MSYRETKQFVETEIAGIAGEWTITARVYLCDRNDRNDCDEVDEWLTATCGAVEMDAEEFLATATDIDRQRLTDALVQEAIDCYEPTDRELSDFYGGRNPVRDHVSGVRVLA